jgi:carbon-monoxide dehydrogenase medium subunit
VTRYAEIEYSPSLKATAPLLVQAMPLVAHPGIRNRGTIGGSVALADPSAETPACCIGLDAKIKLKSRARGIREVAAVDFFHGIYETDARDDEIILGVDIQKAAPNRRFAIREISPRHGDFALAGALAAATLTDGKLSDVRLVFFAVADAPLIAAKAQRALEGVAVRDKRSIDEAANCLAADIDFKGDSQLSAAHRQRISRTLVSRLIADLEGSV